MCFSGILTSIAHIRLLEDQPHRERRILIRQTGIECGINPCPDRKVTQSGCEQLATSFGIRRIL